MARLICKWFGHNEQPFRVGTRESGADLVRCTRCNVCRVEYSWGVPEPEEWPTIILSTEEMQELIEEFKHV